MRHAAARVLERALHEAIARDEIYLCLQPKIDLRSGTLVGAEALARWTRHNGEVVSPDIFIPLAERSSLIVQITMWTLNAALRSCGDYFERFPGIRAYMDATREYCREHGYVETIFGRKCHYPDIKASNPSIRSFNERAAINARLQGSAADKIGRAHV